MGNLCASAGGAETPGTPGAKAASSRRFSFRGGPPPPPPPRAPPKGGSKASPLADMGESLKERATAAKFIKGKGMSLASPDARAALAKMSPDEPQDADKTSAKVREKERGRVHV